MTEGCSEAGLREVSYILVNFLGLRCFACRRSILSLACTSTKFLCIHINRISVCMLRDFRMQALLTVLLCLNLALRPCSAEMRLVPRPTSLVMLMPEHLLLLLPQAWCVCPGQRPAKAKCVCTSHRRSQLQRGGVSGLL